MQELKKNTSSAVLCTLVFLFSFAALGGCSNPGLFTILNEDTMTKEEIRDANEITLQNYFKEIGFTSKRDPSRIISADTAARAFAYANDNLIVSIEGGFEESGVTLLLKVTDSEGQVFDMSVGSSGMIDTIYDEQGELVYCLIM